MVGKTTLFALTLGVLATGYGQTSSDSPSVQERLAALEFQIATLDTRLNTRTTVGAASLGSSESGLAAQIRIDALEREIDDLNRAVRDLSRQVDMARREAAEARREARDAISRIR
jgi:outer membrane murein-binding lipoprotein Lpp